jgi:hypothetical protein
MMVKEQPMEGMYLQGETRAGIPGKVAGYNKMADAASSKAAAEKAAQQGYAKGMQDNNLTSQMAYEQGLAEAQLAMDPRLASLIQQNQDMYGQANTPEIPRSAFLENNRGY